MSDPYIGEIRLFPYNFAPVGWAFCNGQLISISQNTALFSLLGTTYGGNGTTNFALPDLRGRAPISSGQGPGLSNWALGQVFGTENVTVTQAQMPSHLHTVNPAANDSPATATRPGGAVMARVSAAIYASAGDGTTMAANNSSTTGGNQPMSILNPRLVLNYCIALQGIFPSRS